MIRLLALAVILCAPAVAAAQPAAATAASQRVLVLPFVVDAAPGTSGLAGAPFWMGEAAAIAIGDDLAAVGVPTIGRADRLQAFEQLQLPSTGALTRATVIRAGEMIGAAAVVLGEVRLSDRMTVVGRVIDLDTGSQSPDVQASGNADQFLKLLGEVSQSLQSRLPADAPHVAAPPRDDVTAFEDYVKGLVAASPDLQVRFLESALSHAPSDARTLIALWQVRTAQGNHAAALAAARRVPAAASESRAARYLAAQSLVALKRYDEAFKALSDLYLEAPAAPISNLLGVIQLRRGATPQIGTAAYYFNRAVQEARDDADAAFNLGYAYALSGEATSALYWLREAVRRDAADAAAHQVLSSVLLAQAKTVEAQREYDLARVLGAVESGTVPDRRVPAGLERVSERLAPPLAWRQLSIAATEQAQTATYYVERGERLAAEMRTREAIDELRRAIYVSPYLDRPHIVLGRIYQRTGQLDDAIDEFALALWSRESPEAHAAMASAQLARGNREAARAAANRALVMDPENAEARDVLRQLGGMLESP
jgi:tetratricopeptide (TPR) repeat protein